MILLAALMLGGKAFALSDEKIVEIWASEFYSAKKHGSSAPIYSQVGVLVGGWVPPSQHHLIFEWIKKRANTNEGLYELYWLGFLYYNGFGCKMNRQLGIQYIRQAAQLGVREAFNWMNQRGLR